MTAEGVDVSWQWAPVVIFSLSAYWIIYALRWARVRDHNPRDVSRWRAVSFFLGVAVLFIALISPVDPLGEQMFFWHMFQHILLLDIAPILLILGLNRVLLRPVTAQLQRVERAAGWLASPFVAVFLYVGTLYVWHIPALYEAALTSDFVHAFQHSILLFVGMMFWWYALGPIRPRRPLTGMRVAAYMVITKLLTGLLASAITFVDFGSVFTDYYADTPRLWNWSPADDQHVAGALMMFEELMIMTSVFAVMFVRMLGDSDREDQRAERFGAS
jgi:putative membrane protein